MSFLKGIGLAVLTMAVSTAAAFAQDTSTNRVTAKVDWNVFVEDNPKECWSVSTPKEWEAKNSEGRLIAVNRGQILLMVFYRPSAGASGQVAYTGGYPFKSGSTVSVDIGGEAFEMFVGADDPQTSDREDEWAWLPSEADDTRMVEAMKRGAQAVISGVSGRGNQTIDTFSLLGFTASVEDAQKRCAN